MGTYVATPSTAVNKAARSYELAMRRYESVVNTVGDPDAAAREVIEAKAALDAARASVSLGGYGDGGACAWSPSYELVVRALRHRDRVNFVAGYPLEPTPAMDDAQRWLDKARDEHKRVLVARGDYH